MANKCVVRNNAYRSGEFNIRERHNERKNQSYGNGDIEPERSHLNVHFKKCDTTYKKAFDKMVSDGVVSLRGLGKDPKVFDELVFDVNTTYFEDKGGYEYAKKFFEEAYKLAVKEAGGEQYILSAVMHADERNKAVSEKLGRDVFHYHLHVAYVPVVDKEVKWSKRCKDPALVGTVKEVIKQVSHSKKWPRQMQYDENGEVVRNSKGKAVLLNSYSLLQDRFYEHMQAAGFTDFERGEKKSTAVHLDTLEYKIQQDKKAVAALEQKADVLDRHVAHKQKQVATLDKKITVNKKTNLVFSEIESMAKKTILGKMELSSADWKEVSELAKKGAASDNAISELNRKLQSAQKDTAIYRNRWESVSEDTKDFRKARELAPRRTQAALDEVIRRGREDTETTQQTKHRGKDLER